MSRRERRRARARLRDLRVHGVDTALDGNGIAPAPSQPGAFRAMKPERAHATKTSAAVRTRQVTQECKGMNGSDAWTPKGKRRVRFTTTIRWNGSRAAGPNDGLSDEQPRGVRMRPPAKKS